MEKFKKVQSIVSEVADDADKFYTKNNKAAGTRVRKAMQELKNLAQEIRKEVQEIKNKQEAAASKTTKSVSAKKTDNKKAASSKTSTAKTSTKKK